MNRILLYVAVLVVILGLVGASAYLFGQNQTLQKQFQKTAPLAQPTPIEPKTTESTPTASPAPAQPVSKTVVVFEAEGAIPAADKDQLQKRIVDPAIDYYTDLSGAGYVISFTISPNTSSNKADYPYLGKIIFQNGAYESFVITKGASGINWWNPECMGPCPFSDSFKAKYPEVVKTSP